MLGNNRVSKNLTTETTNYQYKKSLKILQYSAWYWYNIQYSNKNCKQIEIEYIRHKKKVLWK